MSTYQVLNEHGQVSGSAMVFDDLTVQKLLDDERRRADQLDFLHKVVGRMAHEVKNPLVSIQTFVDLLAEHDHDPEFTEQFRQVVRRDVRAIDEMTEKLVSFAGKMTYRFEYQHMSAVLQDFAASLTAEYAAVPAAADASPGAPPAAVELAGTELLPLVKSDPEQFHKALTYLGRFLLQDAGAGSPLQVSAAVRQQGPHAEPGEWVYITLTGKGRKLPAEELQRLLDPFCLDQSTFVDIGPCVSQKIIEEHGGCLDVRQEKHGDTTFVVALPAVQDATQENTPWKAANVF
jgi:nitrogen fixation/metabolism regulation signal transduction histidine kinase